MPMFRGASERLSRMSAFGKFYGASRRYGENDDFKIVISFAARHDLASKKFSGGNNMVTRVFDILNRTYGFTDKVYKSEPNEPEWETAFKTAALYAINKNKGIVVCFNDAQYYGDQYARIEERWLTELDKGKGRVLRLGDFHGKSAEQIAGEILQYFKAKGGKVRG